jgi:hypothetical protein
MHSTFEQIVGTIQQAHDALGHTRGWRFLTVPRRTWTSRPDIALLTLNPGGAGPDPSQGAASCEYGCAYRMERWGAAPGQSALQVQVLALLEQLRMRLRPDTASIEFMDERVLGAYYLPFRSPSFAELVNAGKSLEFARSLWTEILTPGIPRLLVTIDRIGFAGIRDILTETFSMPVCDSRIFQTGWGKCRAEVIRCGSSRADATTILRLPHLSTYKLFSRGSCLPHLNEILEFTVAW